jgi:Holliday junction resolvase RusA-like endonuclease
VTTEPLAFDLTEFDPGSRPFQIDEHEPPVLVIVHGRPITQGSKIKSQWGMRDDNAKTLHPWRNSVQLAAETAMAGRARIAADVRLTATFYFDRPQGHFGTGRNAGVLKDSAPKRPTGRGLGDLDKLERAINDSLQAAGVIVDDSQVAQSVTEKAYVGVHGSLDRPGVRILIEALP